MHPRHRLWTYFHSHNGRLEMLEPRNMLSGHAIGQGISHAFRNFSSIAAVQQAQHQTAGNSSASDGSSIAQTVLTAHLTDANSSATGTVTYETGGHCGTTSTTFTVSVTGAAANGTLDVSIGDTIVGQVTTDSSGAGTLKLSSKDSTLPTDFPTTIAAGTVVTVGTLTGTLATATSSESGSESTGDGCIAHSGTKLTASLTDSTGTGTGTATLKTGNRYGTSFTLFSVNVSGAAISTTFDVAIDGIIIGQLITDDTGAGTLTFSSKDSTLPANFPTSVSAGSTITVGTLSGTFAAPSSNSSSLRFARRR